MEHIIQKHQLNESSIQLLNSYFKLSDLMIFDIETTGLSPTQSKVILIGFITFDNDTAYVHQLFAPHTNNEIDILKAFIPYIKDKEVLINFNGSSFDIPYLNKRFQHHQLSTRIHSKKSFDLYRVSKSSKLPVENYKLKTLETFLNIPREDTISGKESIHLYFKYMNSGDTDAKAKVLGHNFEDILHLIPFLKILEHFESSIINRYLPHRININGHTFYLDTTRIQKDYLTLTFSISNPEDYKGMEIHNYEPATLILKKGILEVQIPIFSIEVPEQGQYTFVDAEALGWIEDFNTLDYESKLIYLVKQQDMYLFDSIIECVRKVIYMCTQ